MLPGKKIPSPADQRLHSLGGYGELRTSGRREGESELACKILLEHLGAGAAPGGDLDAAARDADGAAGIGAGDTVAGDVDAGLGGDAAGAVAHGGNAVRRARLGDGLGDRAVAFLVDGVALGARDAADEATADEGARDGAGPGLGADAFFLDLDRDGDLRLFRLALGVRCRRLVRRRAERVRAAGGGRARFSVACEGFGG